MSSPTDPPPGSRVPADDARDPATAPDAAPDRSRPPAASGGSGSAAWLILLAVVVVAVVAFVVSQRRSPPTSPAIGKPAPPIDLIPLVGDPPPLPSPASTAADQLDGVTLLHFWGTWCAPCRQEYPELIEMVGEFSSDPEFHFISVSCEASVGQNSFDALREQTQEFYDSIGAGVPTYCDPAGRTRRGLAELTGHPGVYYPSTLLIDREGKITHLWEGYTPSGVREMREAVDSALGG